MNIRAYYPMTYSDSILACRMNTAKEKIALPENPTGQGIGIAILDTGISPMDDFLLPQNRIVAFRDFVNGKTIAYDDNGHGTHNTGMKSIEGTEALPQTPPAFRYRY